MVISVLAVGRNKALQSATDEYERRAARYWRFEVEEISHGRGPGPGPVRLQEAERLQARLKPRFKLVCLTRSGKSMTSTGLSDWLHELAIRSTPGVHFLVGGAFGLAPDLISRADLTLSLSSFTFPHDVARMLLAEQIYRAGTILKNEPYHKGAT